MTEPPRLHPRPVVMPSQIRRPAPPRLAAIAAIGLAAAFLAGCAAAGSAPTPEPTPKPTPTPVGAKVSNPKEAAALVIASDPRFTGAMEHSADVIGASKWWTSSPLPGGGYTIEVTVGWGDCMAGCIEKHVWTYEVHPDGTLELVAESGDPVPADLPG